MKMETGHIAVYLYLLGSKLVLFFLNATKTNVYTHTHLEIRNVGYIYT